MLPCSPTEIEENVFHRLVCVDGPVGDDVGVCVRVQGTDFEFLSFNSSSGLQKSELLKKNSRRLYLEARGLLQEDEPSPPPLSSDEDILSIPRAPLKPAQRKSRMKR